MLKQILNQQQEKVRCPPGAQASLACAPGNKSLLFIKNGEATDYRRSKVKLLYSKVKLLYNNLE